MTEDSYDGPAADDPRIDALTRASRSIHVAPLDAARVVRAARARRRRRRTIVSSVLAVAVVVAGVSVATAGSSPGRTDRSDRGEVADRTDDPGTPPFPAPPEGTRWVGLDRVVVAVPTEWPATNRTCGTGVEQEVLVGTDPDVACVGSVGGNTKVVIGRPGDLGPAFGNTGFCNQPLPEICYGSAVFDEQDVLVNVAVQSTDAQAQVDRIVDSAMVLPDGWTTVPFGGEDRGSTRADLLTDAGFRVVPTESQADVPVTSEPLPGSPVREGATITLIPLEEGPSLEGLLVTVSEGGYNNAGAPVGVASWDAAARALTYRTRSAYSTCLPDARFAEGPEPFHLVVVEQGSAEPCFNIAKYAVVTVFGLTEPPAELTVTEDDETRTVPVDAPSTVVLLTAPTPSDGTRNARIAGPLGLQGDCVSVGESVAVWPYGTTVVSESPLRIRVPGAGYFSEGDEVVGSGGFFNSAVDDVATVIPSSCGTTRGTTINPERG